MNLNLTAVEAALRVAIERADYDTHKYLEGDESGVDQYPDLAQSFAAAYILAQVEESRRHPELLVDRPERRGE